MFKRQLGLGGAILGMVALAGLAAPMADQIVRDPRLGIGGYDNRHHSWQRKHRQRKGATAMRRKARSLAARKH